MPCRILKLQMCEHVRRSKANFSSESSQNIGVDNFSGTVCCSGTTCCSGTVHCSGTVCCSRSCDEYDCRQVNKACTYHCVFCLVLCVLNISRDSFLLLFGSIHRQLCDSRIKECTLFPLYFVKSGYKTRQKSGETGKNGLLLSP